MAFSLSDYRNIPSTGVIPAALAPADQFSFAYTFIYEKDVDLAAGFSSDINARITLELRDSAGALKATFDAFETYRAVLAQLAPGLVLFSWNWDINKERFTATDAGGTPIETDGAFSLGALPAEGSGTTDRTAIISSTFYSRIFELEIEAGDVLKIKFHNVSAGFTTNKASLKIATRQVDTRAPGLFDPRTGTQFRVFNYEKQVRATRSRQQVSPLPPAEIEWAPFDGNAVGRVFSRALKGLSLARRGGGALYVLGKDGASLKLFCSFDEGENWEQIMAVFNDVTPLASKPSADGSTFFVYGVNAAKSPAFAILKNSSDGWKVETGPCVGTGLPVSKVNALEISGGGELRLLATGANKELLMFTSSDGKTYTPAAIT